MAKFSLFRFFKFIIFWEWAGPLSIMLKFWSWKKKFFVEKYFFLRVLWTSKLFYGSVNTLLHLTSKFEWKIFHSNFCSGAFLQNQNQMNSSKWIRDQLNLTSSEPKKYLRFFYDFFPVKIETQYWHLGGLVEDVFWYLRKMSKWNVLRNLKFQSKIPPPQVPTWSPQYQIWWCKISAFTGNKS